MKLTNINKGGIIYLAKSNDTNVYVIKKGIIQLEKDEGNYLVKGKLTKHMKLVEGDVFGFEDLFIGVKRQEKAIAIEDCEIVYFEYNEFETVLIKNVKIGEKIVVSLASRIREINNSISERIVNNSGCEIDDGNILDIFIYFIKNGNFKNALAVIHRMEEKPEHKEFISIHKVNVDFLAFNEINNAKMEKVIEIFKSLDFIMYEYYLEGLIKINTEQNFIDKIIQDKAEKIKEFTSSKYIEEAVKFIRKYSNSNHSKEFRFDLINKYMKLKKYDVVKELLQELGEMSLSGKEFAKVQKLSSELKYD